MRNHSENSIILARIAPCFALAALLIASSGCAILNRDNTPMLNLVEKHLVPESKPARIAAMPLVFPVGVLAVTADAFVIHPATVVDDAADDVYHAFWDHWRWNDRYMTECAALPWKVILSPPMFLGDFVGRSMFDVRETADKQRRKEAQDQARVEAKARMEKARDLLAQNKPSEAVDELMAANQAQMEPDDSLEFTRLLFTAGAKSKRLEAWDAIRSPADQAMEEHRATIAETRKSNDPYARLHAFRFELKHYPNQIPKPISIKDAGGKPPREMSLLQTMLADPHPTIRMEALARMRRSLEVANHSWEKTFIAAIEPAANSDADTLVRETARQMLRETKDRANWKTRPDQNFLY